jgi:hypothetical protein
MSEPIVESVELSEAPCPEGAWPGGPGCGRVRVGYRPVAELGSDRLNDHCTTSATFVFGGGPDGPCHRVAYNGPRMRDEEASRAEEAARGGLRAAALATR